MYYFKLFLLLGAVVFLSSVKADAQPADCWDLNPCSEPWTWDNHSFSNQGMAANAVYRTRNCNGNIQLIINWDSTTVADPGFYLSEQYEEHDFEGLREALYLHLILDAIQRLNLTIPNCSEDTLTMTTIYESRCGVWVKCSYEIETDADIRHDTGYTGDCPLPWDNNGTNYIDVWKWQPCGDICCIKTFSLCYGSNPIGGGNTLRISNVNWSPAPGAVCSEEGNFRRWEDNTVIPCEDGCKGSGN